MHAVAIGAVAVFVFGTTSPALAAEVVPEPSTVSVSGRSPEPLRASEPEGQPESGPYSEPEPVPEPAPATESLPGPEPSAEPETAEPEPAPLDRTVDRAKALAPTALMAAESVITPFEPGVHRLAGADRFETAVAISQRFSPGVPVLYVATGADFPDALSAAAAAAHHGGPLLLTQAEALPAVVRTEITRLAPQRVIIAGGEGVVGAGVQAELAALLPGISIDRLGGADRFETARLLVDEAFSTVTEAFIATGRDFPDALAASAAAGRLGAPVYLVDGLSPSLRPGTVEALAALGAWTVRIAGGSGAVSAAIEQELAANGFAVLRHEGLDRFQTAAAINAAVFGGTKPTSAFLATGGDFADALAGAALAGGLLAPLYLTRTACIPHPVSLALNELAPPARVILGGSAVVGEEVAAGTACAIGWAKPATGRITGAFGPRDPICTPGGCSQSFHRGVDIGTGCWAPIYAASAGRVSTAGPVGTYGNFIKIAHGSGIDTGYAHLVDGGILVSVGRQVAAGEQIGWSGATGAATGCHLHFEVYEGGTQIDPVPFMSARGVTLG
ncbi:cell wall-binding repeat-containing protein [Agromyces sp. Marseille-P2726]|uniref:cell wall-binding repeat-containing protein n=1 Tax=Agromyces sp. Marseille-P2726 TaxID=2709132 RepID=UPI001570B28E|nr:cell wall-binding repeat-containing protein [Agromyces sp. Marseille-P2726]